MKRILEILAILPGTCIWGSLVGWGAFATLVNRLVSFREDAVRFGFAGALVGCIGEFLIFALPTLGLVILWCLVLGYDGWIHRRPKLRLTLAIIGFLVGAWLSVVVCTNLILNYSDPGSLAIGFAGAGLVAVAARYLWRFMKLYCRAEQNREPNSSLGSE